MKKNILLFVFTLLSTLTASADAVEINGIYYNLNSSDNTAEVTSNPDKYTGNVTIPGSVTYNDVTYDVTSIGSGAFEDCSSLADVTIPNSVTSIGSRAFYGCSYLTNVYCHAKKVPSAASNAFQNSNISITTLNVPRASINAYKAETPWSNFGRIIVIRSLRGWLGDANDDGSINSKDIYLLECYINGIPFEDNFNEDNADFNRDGKITMSDVKSINNFICGEEPSGDVNGDYIIDMLDVNLLVNYLLGNPLKNNFYPYNRSNLDPNDDGKTNMQDVMYVVNRILELK